MSASSSSIRSRFRTLPTHCNCGIRLAKRVSCTKINPFFCPDKCDAFYWNNDELQGGWFKHAMYEMYLTMNGDQRDVFVEEINIHELGILAQERLAYVEADFESYKSRMVLELKREQTKYALWRRISGFMMFVLTVMLVLLLIFI
ncbi:hypothetical protein Tco_0744687 [Tanacetum coccineum]